MYVPESFAENDNHVLREFITSNPFATFITTTLKGEINVSHVPLLLQSNGDRLVLAGHVARANPHWRALDGKNTCLAIFSGPHGYISPRWYAKHPSVPTWNYAVVHAEGAAICRDDPAFTENVVAQLSDRHERSSAAPWTITGLPDDDREKLVQAIVAFEMPVKRLTGKFKLSQNRSPADRGGVIAALEQSGSAGLSELAALMKRAVTP